MPHETNNCCLLLSLWCAFVASRRRPRCRQNPDRVSGLISSSDTRLTFGGQLHKRWPLAQEMCANCQPIAVNLAVPANLACSLPACFISTKDYMHPCSVHSCSISHHSLSRQRLMTAGGSQMTSGSLTGPEALLFVTINHTKQCRLSTAL